MTKLGIQYSTTRPKDIEITKSSIFIATNIKPYSNEIEGHVIEGYQYELTQYDKDEYIAKLHQDIIDTQMALCDLYETIGE